MVIFTDVTNIKSTYYVSGTVSILQILTILILKSQTVGSHQTVQEGAPYELGTGQKRPTRI